MRWHLHLGAHKTATTHIQQTLAAASLRAAFVPLEDLRRATGHLFDDRKIVAKFKFRHRMRRLVGNSDFAVLSEENWLGPSWEGCAFPPYPWAERRLEIVAALGGRAIAFLAVRHPADFAASAFSEALRHNPAAVTLADVRSSWLAGGSPWLALAQQVAQRFPLKVWRFEDYRANSDAILAAIAGQQGPFPHVPDPPATMRVSQEMVDAVETARAEGQLQAPLRDTVRTGERRFEMFDAGERQELGEAYAADLARIEVQMPGVLMRF